MRYKKGKYELPSVTEIISDASNKPALVQWAANECKNYLVQQYDKYGDFVLDDFDIARFAYKDIGKEAMDVGSKVHDYIEDLLHTGLTGIAFKDELNNCYIAFHAWFNSLKNLEVIKTERTVYGNCFAGTLDFEGTIDEKHYIVDWKTSKAFYPEMRYQVAAYRSLTEATHCGVLMLDKKTGEYKFHDTTKTYEKDLYIWEYMLTLYMLRHPRIAKKAGYLK